MPDITDEAVAKNMWKNLKAQAIGIAKLRGLAPGKQEMTPDEEDTIYMRQAPGWTVEQELGLQVEGKSREEIGNLKYPDRMKLAASVGDRRRKNLATLKGIFLQKSKEIPQSLTTDPQLHDLARNLVDK